MQDRPQPSSLENAIALQKYGVGQPVRRKEDDTLVRGKGQYTDDFSLPGQAYAWIVRSSHAHGIIKTLPAWQAAALHYLGQHEASAREGARFVNRIRTTWFGSMPPTDVNIFAGMLHAHPIARMADWERLRDGLHHAGLPVEGRTHDRW